MNLDTLLSPALRELAYQGPDVGRIRKSLGLSQKNLATLMCCSEKTVANWEHGRRIPSPSNMLLLLMIRKIINTPPMGS